MNLTLKLLAACAALSLAAISFSGCGGNDCATGTKESDGQCIPDTTTCGGGTTLVNGKCQLDATGCGEGASLDSTGKCVADAPTGEECGDGTMFDAGTGKCTPTSVITCGANTKNEGGQCVPDTGTCAAGTKLSDDGQCVIDAPACSTGTQLDPNSAKCVVTDQVCGANTAFDAASGTCKTADTVCAAGTTFSADTGLCLPEATCQMGDVIVEGKCVSPSQALAAMATVTSMENDDPRFMGTPNALTIPAMQGDKVIAKGTINAPVDLDADGTPDQDYDFYTIQGTAGQHISVDLAVIAGPSMSFALIGPDGPDNYIRISGQGAKRGASRTFLIPKDGDYSLVVAPSISVLEGDQAGPFGEDGWDYVLSVSNIAAPVATDFDPALNNVAGSFGNLSDNLHKVVNVAPGTIVDMTIENVGRNVEGFVQVWNGPAAYLGEYPAVDGETYRVVMPSTGDTFLFFDWAGANGPQLDYEVSITPLPGQENLGAIPAAGTATSTAVTAASGDIRYISFTLAAGEVAEITHTNDENGTYDVEVSGPNGATVFTDSSFAAQGATSPERAYGYAPNGGSFVVTAEANGARTNSAFTVTSKTPADAGSHMIGGQIVIAQANALAREERDFHKVTLTETAKLTGTLVGGNNETTGDLWIYDLATGQQVAALTTTTAINLNLLAGSYLFAVESNESTLPTGYTLTLDLVTPPALEVEPNDDLMTATPIADLTRSLSGEASEDIAGDQDFWSFTPAQDTVFPISCARTTTAGNPFVALWILDAMGNILVDAGSGTQVGASVFMKAGTTYYIQVGGDSTFFDVTYGYECSFGQVTDLGAIAPAVGTATSMPAPLNNTAQFFSFSATAGEVIELTHTNDANGSINVIVTDSDNQTVFSDSTFNTSTTTTTSLEKGYFLVPVDGTYVITARSSTARVNSAITVKSMTPNALGSFMVGQQIVGVQPNAVTARTQEFHTLTLSSDAKLSGTLTAGATLRLYGATGNLITTITSGNVNLTAPAGDYLVSIEAPSAGLPMGYNLTLNLVALPPFYATPALAIPDNNATGVSTMLTVATMNPCLINTILVDMDISHTYRGDLTVRLTSPNNTTLTLHAKTGSSADNIVGVYGVDLTSSDDLAGFTGEDANGVWTLFANDTGGGDSGTINAWGLTFTCQ